MATSVYFNGAVQSEQNLYEDLVLESIKMFGQDVVYIPREQIYEDAILNETYNQYRQAFPIECFIENTEGFEGDGNLLGKFGLEIRDQGTFVIPKRRWQHVVGANLSTEQGHQLLTKPGEGDLIWMTMTDRLFEIKYVEPKLPFFQIQDLPTYTLTAELFEYNDQNFDTGIPEIDNIELKNANSWSYTTTAASDTNHFEIGEYVHQDTGSVDGDGASDAANAVVDQIISEGGEAIANGASVTDLEAVQDMVKATMDKWGRIDILVNNAGILRDKSFHKDTIDSFNIVMDVHFQGTLNCTHTIFPIMREQGYGRIIFTSSSSGVFGNFGQANYGSAKMAMIGLMNTLKLEGQKYNVFTNSITPVAYTRMTEGLIPEDFGKNLQPEFVSPAVLYLASDQAPNGTIMAAGAGVFSRIHIHETMGVSLGTGQDMTPENIAANWDNISDMKDARALQNGGEQTLMIFELLNKDS